MSDFTITELTDTTRETLEMALRACGLPLTLRHSSFQLEGSGAWHDAYRVTVPQHARPFIVRIRKTEAYGQPQRYADNADDWHAEYVSTSLYYMQANRAMDGICPSMFLYNVSEEITCTIETHMGTRLNLETLSEKSARQFGRQIGSMMCNMHQKKTHIPGSGEIAWDGANLYGVSTRDGNSLTRKIEQAYNENILLALKEEAPRFDHDLVTEKLDRAQNMRDVDEPVVLINRDVTPENLTVQRDGRVGIIDPYPYLGNGTRFAAWFIHCYRFLLPAYADTPRYRQNNYDQHSQILAMIADGFEYGYIRGNETLARHIRAERWLWTLEQAYDDMERLNRKMSDAAARKHGDHKTVQRRMKRALRVLETLDF
ncbi:MAG: phosphotransferase [Chloroflexota bacterium]